MVLRGLLSHGGAPSYHLESMFGFSTFLAIHFDNPSFLETAFMVHMGVTENAI